MEVVLVRWPDDEAGRALLCARRHPRLLLIEGDVLPPGDSDDLEDWIRVPAAEHDVATRLEALERRARFPRIDLPEIDEHGILRLGDAKVAIPPVEARVMSELLGRYGAVVGRDALSRAAWPDRSPSRNALDVHVLRLRRRIASLGLAIRTVRSRGYLLEREPLDPAPSPET